MFCSNIQDHEILLLGNRAMFLGGSMGWWDLFFFFPENLRMFRENSKKIERKERMFLLCVVFQVSCSVSI